MAEDSTYIITVKPKGVPLDEADDTREFEFTTDTTDTDALETEATNHILDNELIDPSTFRTYWEIADVAPPSADDTETGQPIKQTLKGRLCMQTPSDVKKMRQRWNPSHMVLHFEDTSGTATTAELLLTDANFRSISKWLRRLAVNEPAVQNASQKLIGEAMIRTVADEIENGPLSSNLITDFNRLRSTHDRFIKAVMQNESAFLSHLAQLQP